MSNNHAKEPVVYVRRRIRKQPIGDVVANVDASANQKEFSSREIGQTSPKPQQPNKLLENKEAKTIKKGRTNYSSNTSNWNTISSKGGGAGNAKVNSDDKEEKHKTWKPQTQEETHLNELALVYDGNNIDYVTSQLDFAKDLGEAADTRVCSLSKSLNDNISRSSYNNAKRKGKDIYQERNNKMDFADFYAQRRNKGITICEKSENSRPGEMAKLLETSNNNHSSGQILQFQDMNQVSPNYLLNNGMEEMRVWPRVHHKPRTIVHPSKVIGPSRFSQYYDQYMQRTTSVSAPVNFSLMKLLMGDENSSTLTDEELMYAKELLTTTQDLSSGGQRVQLQPCSQVGNYQDVQGTSNFSYMRLLMEDEDSSILSEELNENQFLSTQYSLSSEGQRVQHWPGNQVGNYQFEKSAQQINLQGCQNQVLQKVSYMDLLTRDDISYMDLLTREDISWT